MKRTKELLRKTAGRGRIKEGKKKAVAKVERISVKMKRRKTEEKKTTMRRTKELLRKTAGRIKEGKKKAVAKVERIQVKMKRRKTEEKKSAVGKGE